MSTPFPIPDWPLADDGSPEPPALLLDAKNAQELLNTQMLLTGLGIPFLIADRDKTTFTKVLFGTNITGAMLYVPASLLDDAREVISGQSPVISDEFYEEDENEQEL